MKLLREIDTIGAPPDYLFARIRCRRAALDTSGQRSWRGPADPRQALRAEYVWIYRQLDRRLRRKILPFFEYVELRSLVIALRYLAAGEQAALQRQLDFSLLDQQLQSLLLGAERVAPVTSALERLLAAEYPFFVGLAEIYLRQGPGGLEQALLGGCLQQAVGRCRGRLLHQLMSYLRDMRNLLAVYKHLHWQVPSAPPLLAGGELDLSRCEKICATGDLAGLLELMKKFAGQPGNPEAVGVEAFLMQGLTNRLRRAGRDPLQPGLVLDYLWRCQLAARNRGLRLSGASGEKVLPHAKGAG